MSCVRCDSEKNIERHHIKQKIDGGTDDDENLEDRCRPCHKYEHARRNVLKALGREDGQKDRLDILNARLETLEKWNMPELIRERGTFQSYAIRPELTHPLPRRKSQKAIKRELQLSFDSINRREYPE